MARLRTAVVVRAWDVQDHVRTPERQLGYLDAAFEDGDPALIAAALSDIAEPV